MKAKDVQVGQVYLAKISGKQRRVRILRETSQDFYGYRNGRYGVIGSRIAWDAENLDTGRPVFIKSAAKLHLVLDYDKAMVAMRKNLSTDDEGPPELAKLLQWPVK